MSFALMHWLLWAENWKFARNFVQTLLVKEDCEEEKEEEEETLMEEESGNRTASSDLWPLVNVIVAIMMTMHFVTQTITDGSLSLGGIPIFGLSLLSPMLVL